MTTARVLIVDDEPLVGRQLERDAQRAGHTVVGVAHSANEALALVGQEAVDVAIVDIDLGEPFDGLDLAPALQARCGASFVFLTGGEVDATWPSRAVSLDAVGLFLKPLSPVQLEVAIALALERRAQPVRLTRAPGRPPHAPVEGGGAEALAELSTRQREVVVLLRQGLNVARVADRLSVSAHTVRNHLKAAYKKLEVHSQVELLAKVSGRDSAPR